MITGAEDKTVRLWNTSDGTLIKTLEGHSDVVTSVAISFDGTLLASGSKDGKIMLWRIPDGTLLSTFEGWGYMKSLSFTPDGTILASASDDTNNTIMLWSVPDATVLMLLEGSPDDINSIVFSPDGTLLASASDDGTVRLWGVKP
jgi:WD40 repeat protein